MRYAVILLSILFLSGCASTGAQFHQASEPVGERQKILDIARSYLGVPYKYGGTTPAGFDCSGYVRYVFNRAGYSLPHNAGAMFQKLKKVEEPRPGDLVFYHIDGSTITHVGIYASRGRFLHSPKSGQVVEYTDMNAPYWKKRYAGSARVVGN